ncbi:MAG: AvaI/BsoBI family type II restriction endonuclease [Bellilinea sp.]|jgi:hypothetical protein
MKEATRAGFVALALEKNRKAVPYVAEARALQNAALSAKTPADLLKIKGIESGLLTAAGLSDKSLKHLLPEDKAEAINGLIKNFLEPAGSKFIEELVFRFLLTRGDALGEAARLAREAAAEQRAVFSNFSASKLKGFELQVPFTKGGFIWLV